MRPINCSDDNVNKINQVLDVVNGRAQVHTATANDVLGMATFFEQQLRSLLPKKHWRGARWIGCLCPTLPNSYRGSVRVTHVTLEARPSGSIYLIDAEMIETWPRRQPHGGTPEYVGRVYLTNKQSVLAVEIFCKRYSTYTPATNNQSE